MPSEMTPELRRLMRYRPWTERLKLWWLMRRLDQAQDAFYGQFVTKEDYVLAGLIRDRRSASLERRIFDLEEQIAAITQPVLRGDV